MSDKPMFTPRAPRKRSGGSPMGPIVAAVVVLALGAGGYWWMTRPVDAKIPLAAAPGPSGPSFANDADGFRAATEGELAAYETAVGQLGLGESLDVAKARADVDGYRKKVGKSQMLVGYHRNKVTSNIRNARLNANRRAGGGAEGQRAMEAFDSAHADAVKRMNERWMLEAKVAEERGLVMQTLAYDPHNGQRVASDLGELRAAEARLKTFRTAKS